MNANDASRPLSEEEIIAFRAMLEKDRRVAWVWATLRVWVGWFAAIASFYVVAKALFADLFTRLMK